MAAPALRFALIFAAIFRVASGDVEKSSFYKNEVKRAHKIDISSPEFWLKGKTKEYGEHGKVDRSTVGMRDRTLEKLQKEFGVPGDVGVPLAENPRRRKHRQVPPPFMMELYREVADPHNGAFVGENPFGADVVRSYSEQGSPHSDFLIFDISGLAPTEQVLEAEIHLYRMRPSARSQHGHGDNKSMPPYHLIRVYEALSNDTSLPVDSHRLLSVQHVSDVSSSGWHVLNVREAVLDWLGGTRHNHGLIVTVSSPADGGERRLAKEEVRIARRNEHRKSRQPILVLFNSEGERRGREAGVKLRHPWTGYPNYYKRAHYEEGGEQFSESEERRRRESPIPEQTRSETGIQDSNGTSVETRGCVRKDLYVDFAKSNWNNIIAPAGYNSYQCLGQCDFPLGQEQNPTNYAIVRSVIHELGLVSGVKKPCCVPSKLRPLPVLYVESNTVVLKKYHDMVVESCRCQ